MSAEEGEEVAVKDPLAIASGAFIVGAFLGPPSRLWLAIALAVVLLAFVAIAYKKRGRVPFLALAIGAAQAGMLAVAAHIPDPQPLYDRAAAAAGRPVMLEGTIAEVPDRSAYGTTLIVELTALSQPSTSSAAPVVMFAPPDLESAGGRVRLTVVEDFPEQRLLDYGDKLRVVATFSEPEAHLIPAFRARGIAVRRGVALTGGTTTSNVMTLRPIDSLQSPDGTRGSASLRWREKLVRQIGAPTLAAIALSDRSRADPAQEQHLTHHGASFVFALGGAAMAALAFAISLAAARASKRPRFGALAALPIAVALTAAHGFTPSAIRVGVTLVVLFAWNAIRDRPETRRALPASIIVVLAADPAALGDTFYQLAVASITAVVTVYPAFREHLRHRALQPLLLLATLAFATAPLITRQFDRITLLSLVANMVNLPLAAAIVAPFALLGGVLHQPWMSSIAELARAALIDVPVTRAMATPTVLECALFYTAVFSFAVRPATRTSTGTAVLAVIALAVAGAGSRFDRHPQIGILPGGFVVVEDEAKGVLVYGTGEATADPEAGTRILDQYLKKRRLTELAVLVLPGPGRQEAAVKRQHEIGEVRYAADPLEEVRARLGPELAIRPGFAVERGDQRYFSWKDGLITVRTQDGERRVEAYLQR